MPAQPERASGPSGARERQVTRRLLLSGVGLAAVGLFSGVSGMSSRSDIAVASSGWPSGLRGACVSSRIDDEGIAAFAATGGNLVRVMCSMAPLRDLTAPFALNPASFTYLDDVIKACRRHGVWVVLDPHTFPGTTSRDTIYPSDAIWTDKFYQDLVVDLWEYVAQRYRAASDVIVGYDLVNEPAVPDVTATSGLASWNALADRLVSAIRAHDREQMLIIEPAVGPGPGGDWVNRFQAVRYLAPLTDRRTVVSLHMYAPHAFTMQGVQGRPTGYAYPGEIDNHYWDKAALASYMAPARTYQQDHSVPVYIGEFSAARWTGADGDAYLQDCIDLFEQFGWSWTYLGWRQYEGWDAEMGTRPDDTHRYQMTPRLSMLERYYRRNPTSGRRVQTSEP